MEYTYTKIVFLKLLLDTIERLNSNYILMQIWSNKNNKKCNKSLSYIYGITKVINTLVISVDNITSVDVIFLEINFTV